MYLRGQRLVHVYLYLHASLGNYLIYVVGLCEVQMCICNMHTDMYKYVHASVCQYLYVTDMYSCSGYMFMCSANAHFMVMRAFSVSKMIHVCVFCLYVH